MLTEFDDYRTTHTQQTSIKLRPKDYEQLTTELEGDPVLGPYTQDNLQYATL